MDKSGLFSKIKLIAMIIVSSSGMEVSKPEILYGIKKLPFVLAFLISNESLVNEYLVQ